MNIIILMLLVWFGFAGAVEVPDDEALRIELIADQMYSDQSEVWPTLDWRSAPLIVSFPNGHLFFFNFKSLDPAFEKIPVKGHTVLFTTNDKWGVANLHMQSEFEIEGQSAFVYQMKITPSSLHDVAILAHERFHRHQMEMFEMNEGQGISLDHLDDENLTWAEIEDQLLRDFLKSTNEEKLEHLKDFVSVNTMRRAAIDPLTKQWENGQLRMEGLADYVSTKAYGGESLLLSVHPEEDHQDDFIDEAIKWRHYMAGAALGFALDYIGVKGWQKQVQNGEVLPDLLSKSMPINKSEQEKRIKKVALRLNYKKRRKLVKDKVDRYFKRVAHLSDHYEKIDGVKMFLGRPPVSISGGGANDEMVYLDEGSVVALNDTSVATTSDGNWSFKTKKISHLFQHLQGVREVKVEKTALITIDQATFTLHELIQEPKEYPFKHLKIECESSSLNSGEHVGILIVDKDGVRVKYL